MQLANLIVTVIKGYLRGMLLLHEKKQTPLHVSPDILVAIHLKKNMYDSLLTKWPEMSKLCSHLEMTSSGRAEKQNIKTTAISAILIFSSATKGHFSNVNILLTSLAT